MPQVVFSFWRGDRPRGARVALSLAWPNALGAGAVPTSHELRLSPLCSIAPRSVAPCGHPAHLATLGRAPLDRPANGSAFLVALCAPRPEITQLAGMAVLNITKNA